MGDRQLGLRIARRRQSGCHWPRHWGYTTTRASNAYGLASARPPEPVPPGETDRGRLAGSEGLFDSRGRAATCPHCVPRQLCTAAPGAPSFEGAGRQPRPDRARASVERDADGSGRRAASCSRLKKDQLAYYGPFRCVSTDIRVDSMARRLAGWRANHPERPRAPLGQKHIANTGGNESPPGPLALPRISPRLDAARPPQRALEPPPGRGVGNISRGQPAGSLSRAPSESRLAKYSVPRRSPARPSLLHLSNAGITCARS